MLQLFISEAWLEVDRITFFIPFAFTIDSKTSSSVKLSGKHFKLGFFVNIY